MRHADLSKVDPEWLDQQKAYQERRRRDLLQLRPRRPDPRSFLKKNSRIGMIETHRDGYRAMDNSFESEDQFRRSPS